MIHIASIPRTQQIITKPASNAVWNLVDAVETTCHSVPVVEQQQHWEIPSLRTTKGC